MHWIARKNVEQELKHIKKWLDANKLALNVNKTNFIIFHSPQNSLDETFLGLLLDENLNWKFHLSELSKKLARTCGIF